MTRVLLWLPAALAIGFAAWLAGEQLAFRATATRVEGTVVEHDLRVTTSSTRERLRGQRESQTTYVYLVVEYADDAGDVHRVTSATGSGRPVRAVGEKIGVFFDPASPAVARIDHFLEVWFNSLLVLCMTAGVYVIGFLIARKLRRKQ